MQLRWRRATNATHYIVVARIDSTPTGSPMNGTFYGRGDSVGRGVVLAQTLFALGFSTVFLTAFWTERVAGYEALAQTLGATRGRVVWRVLVPLARGLLVLCFFQTFLVSWFQYGLTLLIGQGKVQTLPLKVFAYLNEANPYVAALAACLLVAPPFVLLWINRRMVFRPGGGS